MNKILIKMQEITMIRQIDYLHYIVIIEYNNINEILFLIKYKILPPLSAFVLSILINLISFKYLCHNFFL